MVFVVLRSVGFAMNSFTVKNLRFTFILPGNVTFDGTQSNTLQVAGLRASVNIKGAGAPTFPEAEFMIYGLTQSDMNKLTAVNSSFQPLAIARSTVIIEADSGQGFGTVFSGQIITSGPEYASVPYVPLKGSARVLGFESLNPATPTSYTGSTTIVSIVQAIADKLGYTVENNGVTGSLNKPYFPGTLVDQLRAVKQQAGISMYTDKNVIAICPAGQPRDVPGFTLSPSSGLVGWPGLDLSRGFVQVKSLYNPAYVFGGPLTVQDSGVPLANGQWVIGTYSHSLESFVIGQGKWFSELLLYPPSLGIPVLQ
jgi:hypothetical protein